MKSEAGSVLRSLAAAELTGAATGGCSFTGVATLALTAQGARPVVKALLCLAAAGEHVADKLPMTPSRVAPPGGVPIR